MSSFRWDRLGRVTLLGVFVLVAVIGTRGAMSYLATRGQALAQQASDQALAAQYRQLAQEQRSLQDPRTIVAEARTLGWIRPGEQPFVVTGLPNR